MGESKGKREKAESLVVSSAGVQTAGGRIQVRWATSAYLH
jgi:hypothetical protein